MQIQWAFRKLAEFNLKIYLRVWIVSAIEASNSYNPAWFGLKSKHFSLEVCIFAKKFHLRIGGTHIDVTTLQRNAHFI